ncbi:hypothetical protein MHYP_G00003400 [Metynnis hypsauchen]
MADKTRQSFPLEDSICALCEDYLTAPVVLRCCHRLCKSCLCCYWELTGSLRCPVCLREPSCEVLLHSLGSKPGSNGAEAASSNLLVVKNTRIKMIEQSRRNKLKDDQQLVNTEICSRNQKPDPTDQLTSSKVAMSPKVAQTSLKTQSLVMDAYRTTNASNLSYLRAPTRGPRLEQLQKELQDYVKRLTNIHREIFHDATESYPNSSQGRGSEGVDPSKPLFCCTPSSYTTTANTTRSAEDSPEEGTSGPSRPRARAQTEAASSNLVVKNTGSKMAQPKMGLPRSVSTVASDGSEKSGTANQMWMEIKYEPVDQKITATFSLEETFTCGFKAETEQSRRNKLNEDEQLVNTEICSRNRKPDSTDQLTSSKFARSPKVEQTSLNIQSPVTAASGAPHILDTGDISLILECANPHASKVLIVLVFALNFYMYRDVCLTFLSRCRELNDYLSIILELAVHFVGLLSSVSSAVAHLTLLPAL